MDKLKKTDIQLRQTSSIKIIPVSNLLQLLGTKMCVGGESSIYDSIQKDRAYISGCPQNCACNYAIA